MLTLIVAALALGRFLLGNVNAGGAMTAALAFQDLTLGYDRLPAVRDLQAEIAEGSLTAIVGPNGAGKSTLLKGGMGTLSPMEGEVSFGSLTREDIAYLPQQSDIDRSFPLSVVDLVAMGLVAGDWSIWIAWDGIIMRASSRRLRLWG